MDDAQASTDTTPSPTAAKAPPTATPPGPQSLVEQVRDGAHKILAMMSGRKKD
jgi:hypothetical protein